MKSIHYSYKYSVLVAVVRERWQGDTTHHCRPPALIWYILSSRCVVILNGPAPERFKPCVDDGGTRTVLYLQEFPTSACRVHPIACNSQSHARTRFLCTPLRTYYRPSTRRTSKPLPSAFTEHRAQPNRRRINSCAARQTPPRRPPPRRAHPRAPCARAAKVRPPCRLAGRQCRCCAHAP